MEPTTPVTPGAAAPRSQRPEPHAPEALNRLTAAVFDRLARWRDARPFHPRGISYGGVLQVLDAGPSVPFAIGPSVPAVARLSTAVGLPPRLPDLFGLGLRIPDAYGSGRHQDLLLASSSRAPLLRHLPTPTRGFDRRLHGTLLAYRHDGRLALVGARYAGPPRSAPLHLDGLDDAAARGELVFGLAVSGLSGPWRPVGRLVLRERLPDVESASLRFDPWNATGSFRPVGPLNHVRAAAYRSSRRAATSP